MRIAIYGGSYNPPHKGHIHVAEAVAKELMPDKIIIIPSNLPPHKEQADGSPDAAARLEMCRLAFGHIPNAEISDIEIQRGGKSYTCDTVHQFREIYPDAELLLIIGADMVYTFDTWDRFNQIVEECLPVAVARENNQTEALQDCIHHYREDYNMDFRLLYCKPVVASSSEVRAQLAAGVRPDALTDEVYCYIFEHGFYQGT